MMLISTALIALLMSSVTSAALSTLACNSKTTMKEGERVAVQSPNFPSNYPTNRR